MPACRQIVYKRSVKHTEVKIMTLEERLIVSAYTGVLMCERKK